MLHPVQASLRENHECDVEDVEDRKSMTNVFQHLKETLTLS